MTIPAGDLKTVCFRNVDGPPPRRPKVDVAASILLWLADCVPVGGIQVVRLDFWNGREQTLLVDDVLRKAIGWKPPIRAAAAQ